MEIVIDGESEELKIIDHIIREMDVDLDGEKTIKKPHFQAKVKLKNDDTNLNYDCDISYYDEDNKFVGLDDTYFHLTGNKQNMPSSFSTELNIPEAAAKMVITFTSEKENNFVNIAVGIAVVCGLILLGAWTISTVMGLFSS
jgi:hypothetical protein